MKSHNIVSKKRIMQSLHFDFAKQKLDQQENKNSIKKNKNSIKKNWKYLIFSHINRSDSLTNFSQIRKIRFCIFRIDVCSQCISRIRCIIFFIDFSIVFSFAHLVDIFYEHSTVKLHKYRFIDVAKSIWKFWKLQWCYMMWFAFSFVIAELKQLIFVSKCIVYSILNIKFHIDVSFHENTFKTFHFSNIRSIFRSHALQFDSTSYLKSINHRISIRSFLQSSHRCMISSRWKSLLENFKQYVVEKILKYASLRKLYRWKNLHENFKSNQTR